MLNQARGSDVFGWFKSKYYGREVYGLEIRPNSKGYASRIQIWKKDGEFSVWIKSSDYWYAQGPGMNWASLKFETEVYFDLVEKMTIVETELRRLQGLRSQ